MGNYPNNGRGVFGSARAGGFWIPEVSPSLPSHSAIAD